MASETAAPERESAVRFASKAQEIEPVNSLHLTETITPEDSRPGPLPPDTQAELRRLSLSLHNSRLQEGRLRNFAFEPVSLPPSRVSICLTQSLWADPQRNAG